MRVVGGTVEDDPIEEETILTVGGGGGETFAAPITVAGTGLQQNIASTVSSVPARGLIFTGAAPEVGGVDSGTAGRVLSIVAKGGPVTLKNEAAGSTAANRIATPGGTDFAVTDESAAFLVWSANDSRWHVAGGGVLPEDWSVLSAGRMHLTNVRVVDAPLLTFAAAGDTITRDAGSWIDDGFEVGMLVTVDGSVSNDGTYPVTNVSALVLTVSGALVNEGPVGSVDVRAQQGYMTVGVQSADYPDDGLIRVNAEAVALDVITQKDGASDRTVLRVDAGNIQLGSGSNPGDGVVRIYGGDGVDIGSGTGFFQLNGPVEQNGNLALLGPEQGSPEWEGGFRVCFWYGVNAGVTAPTASPTNGVYQWCKNDNQSSPVSALWFRYPDDVIKVLGGKRSEHQQGPLKIIPLTGYVQIATTSQTVITGLEFTMIDETQVTFVFSVDLARRTNVTKSGHYEGRVTYRRTSGGAPTIVGAAVYQTDQETTAGDTVQFVVVSNTISVRVTAADTDGRNVGGEMRVSQMDAT